MLGKKWKPNYFTTADTLLISADGLMSPKTTTESPGGAVEPSRISQEAPNSPPDENSTVGPTTPAPKKKKPKKTQQLSTKRKPHIHL